MTRIIKRTPASYRPKAAAWVLDAYGWGTGSPYADTVHMDELPTHSPVLGPDGSPLKYEPPQPVGFCLKPTGDK